MRTGRVSLGALVSVGAALVAGMLGCDTAPKNDVLDGHWQGSGSMTDGFVVTQDGQDVSGQLTAAGTVVGTVSGTNVDHQVTQVTLNVVVYESLTPDGVIDNFRFSIAGHFVDANTISGTESDSPGSTVTLKRM
jgi:hypothetical protein